MLRKPSYCCNCGDKVERLEWHIWNSRRFCELCETEFQFDEWWPRVGMAIILIFGITGIGFHYGGESAEADFDAESLPAQRFAVKKKPQTESSARPVARDMVPVEQELENENTASFADKPANKPDLNSSRKSVPEKEKAPEEIHYCGAMTKKGTPCARRVKGGGRCWQHKDQ